ncbi:MAG: tRNA (adenosine(37)-N6)-dimethylallyltransferase MiaA [Lachnospiraceae bacterium]|nr:tRNA (adenosine(37)-N6)-dimethylallyltransferase MiaA [Lachnospiraceae bacterium]
MKKPPLLILTGPTAVGKTELSLKLAKRYHGAIISADSMQVYRRMDIGTAKLPEDQREQIPHYLIDIREPEEGFHIVDFQKESLQAIQEIRNAGQVPILTGGTGFYIQSVLYPIDFNDESDDPTLRKKLENMLDEKGAGYLHRILRRVDPLSAARIHPNNARRTIRALEFYFRTKTSIAEHNDREAGKESGFSFCYFVLTMERETLYRRIDERVDQMIRDGLVEEVQMLLDEGIPRDATSMQGLGYKEIASYLSGEVSLEEAIRILKRDTRHFAKRQLTWFRRERDVIWIKKEEFDNDENRMLAFMEEKIRERTGL